MDSDASQPNPSAHSAGRNPGQPTQRPVRILLALDNAGTLRVLGNLLQRTGHEVVRASSFAEAQEVAQGYIYDALVVSRELPDGPGVDLFHQLRQQRPIEAIVISDYAMLEDIARSKLAGFKAHLVKPIDFQVLRKLLKQVPRLDG